MTADDELDPLTTVRRNGAVLVCANGNVQCVRCPFLCLATHESCEFADLDPRLPDPQRLGCRWPR